MSAHPCNQDHPTNAVRRFFAWAARRRGLPRRARDELRRWSWCLRCAGHGYLGRFGLPYFWARARQAWLSPCVPCPRRCLGDTPRALINVLHDMEA